MCFRKKKIVGVEWNEKKTRKDNRKEKGRKEKTQVIVGQWRAKNGVISEAVISR